MHIAVCNDIISHRKHLERLLKRESELVKKQNHTLYIDSFGHPEALFSVAMMYDLFFIEMENGIEEDIIIAKKLRELAAGGLLVIIQNSTDSEAFPSSQKESLAPLVFIEKPLQPEKLHELIELAYEHKKHATAPIEIRGEKETFYIPSQQILYIEFDKEMANLYKVDGSCYTFMANYQDLAYSMEQYPDFYVNQKCQIVNVNYIEKLSFGKMTLTNKKVLPYPLFEKNYLEGLIHYVRKNKV
jgi:DNA-binding LytR/AlgR family response regulator